MTATGLWQDIGAGENLFTRAVRLLFLIVAAAVLCFLAMLPLTWPQQAILGLMSILMALAIARGSDSYLVTLALMMLSVILARFAMATGASRRSSGIFTIRQVIWAH